jgi:MerR family transcriptional regulator/heat shock protein HspR
MKNNKYSIGKAAEMAGISVHTLRMYEREGLIIPERKGSKQRRYNNSDVNRIKCIREMINTNKMTIEAIRRMLSHIPCWAIVKCSKEERENCGAYNGYFKPCWMLKNKPSHCADIECRECSIYNDFVKCGVIKDTLKELLN